MTALTRALYEKFKQHGIDIVLLNYKAYNCAIGMSYLQRSTCPPR